MDTNFRRLMGDAARLTRGGDLDAATRAIREALGREPATVAPPVPDDGGAGTPGSSADASIIEGEWVRTDRDSDRASAVPDPFAARARRTARADHPGGLGRGTPRADRSRAFADRDVAGGQLVRARHAGRTAALDYRLFVPTRPEGAPPPALVVMLHGCTQDADDFAVGTRMDALAAEHGFLALYPEQSGQANPQRCWNWFKHTHQRRGGGEAGLIEGCVRAVADAYGADPARVFVAGLSAGGAMAAILGDVCPELFAGVGVHSGLAAGAATNLPEALAAMRGGQGAPAPSAVPGAPLPPTIVFHGDADRTVHPDNGERVVEACLAAAGESSIVVPTIERGPEEGRDRGWTRRVHRDAARRVIAEHWLVHGAGHAWSGGDRRGSYADGAGPDASAEMVRFFLETSR